MASNETPSAVTPDTEAGGSTSTALSANGLGDAKTQTPFGLSEVEAHAPSHTPERRCILTGAHDARDNLIRLAVSPDGNLLPDVRAKAPGRGAWIGVGREALEAAQAKGKLKGALARSFKGKPLNVPDDLSRRIETALERAFLDRLGLEARSGALVLGSDRIEEAARKGRVQLLMHAADAGTDGSRKLDQALRVGRGEEGSGLRGMALPVSRTILAMALGRENVVHIALVDRAAAQRVSHALARWRGFIGLNDGAEPRDSSRGVPFSTADNADGSAPSETNDTDGDAAGQDRRD